MLKIAANLSLPVEAVTQTFALIARKGAGKSYGAMKLAELMLGVEAQVVAIDIVGNWYGLRLGADGKSPGLGIYVMGGEHGDLPLAPELGRRVAGLVVEKTLSVVLDVSSFHKADRVRFATDFAEEFFHLKKTRRTPVHLFVEEAQKFIPQMSGKDEKRMLGAWEDIVRLGRNYGIGATLVSQRPQSVNKEVLSQVECMIVLQTTGLHERKALEAWLTEHDGDRELAGVLPGLQTGEAFVWSPGWLRRFQKIKILPKTTFDSSATPTAGQKQVKPGLLSPMDIEVLKGDLADVMEKAKADDPKELKRQIADLKKQLGAKREPAAIPEAAEIERAKAQAVKESEMRWRKKFSEIERILKLMHRTMGAGISQINQARDLLESLWLPLEPVAITEIASRTAFKAPKLPAPLPPRAPSHLNGSLPKGEQKVLRAIAQYGEAGASRNQLQVLTGYRRSSRDTYIQRLRERGYVSIQGDTLLATQEGIGALGSDFEELPTGDELREYWMQRLPEGERRILKILTDRHPDAVQRSQIDEATEYKRSSRDTYLQRLSARRLVEFVGRGEVKASADLF